MVYNTALWHPCMQMKDFETFPPLRVKSAQGIYIELEEGRKIIDAISSWWCKSLGHGHPKLQEALIRQARCYEHVILANTTSPVIETLSKRLCNLTKTLNKALYASDGSCAIEMAIKMSVHARMLLGQHHKTEIMALTNSYHGETSLALSVSDVGIYRAPYKSLLKPCHFIQPIPYVNSCEDLRWTDCTEEWGKIQPQLDKQAKTLTAIIVEPIIQGAGGMQIYSKDFLKRLREWCNNNDIHLIADEIMTGFGRTGLALACQHADIEPDFLCLGKNLTGGWLPMSAMLTSDKIYYLFYDDYETKKAFLHSHTYGGNALAASVALACLDIYEEENIFNQVREKETLMIGLMKDIADKTKKLKNVRGIGGIVAADLIAPVTQRLGYEIYKKGIALGALLRPLGNTIYWMPPLIISHSELLKLADITERAVASVS